MDFTSTTEEKIVVRINPTTTSGKPSAVEAGSTTLSILTGGAAAVMATQAEIDADVAAGNSGLVGFLVSEDAAGTSAWQVQADADLGAGVLTISDGGTYSYNSPQAANLGVSGSAVPK